MENWDVLILSPHTKQQADTPEEDAKKTPPKPQPKINPN